MISEIIEPFLLIHLWRKLIFSCDRGLIYTSAKKWNGFHDYTHFVPKKVERHLLVLFPNTFDV